MLNMNFFYARVLVIMVLISVAYSTVQNSSCPITNLKPRKILKHFRKNFIFVEKPASSLGTQGGVSRDVPMRILGNTNCPWTWGYDDNPDRVPRFLSKAVCPSCKHYCRKVPYRHKVLMQKCDVTSGEQVWKWTDTELPVSYVYDP